MLHSSFLRPIHLWLHTLARVDTGVSISLIEVTNTLLPVFGISIMSLAPLAIRPVERRYVLLVLPQICPCDAYASTSSVVT